MVTPILALRHDADVWLKRALHQRVDRVPQPFVIHRKLVVAVKHLHQPGESDQAQPLRGIGRQCHGRDQRVVSDRVSQTGTIVPVVLGNIPDQLVGAAFHQPVERFREPGMIHYLGGVISELDVEIGPIGRPDALFKPRPHQVHNRPVLAGGARKLVKLDPVKALQPGIRQADKAGGIKPVPPLAVGFFHEFDSLLPGGSDDGDRIVRRSVGGLQVFCPAIGDRDQDCARAIRAGLVAPGRGVIIAVQEGLGHNFDSGQLFDAECRVGGVANIFVTMRGHGRSRVVSLLRPERALRGAFPPRAFQVQHDQRSAGGNEAAEFEGAGGRLDFTPNLGIPEIDAEMDILDFSGRG